MKNELKKLELRIAEKTLLSRGAYSFTGAVAIKDVNYIFSFKARKNQGISVKIYNEYKQLLKQASHNEDMINNKSMFAEIVASLIPVYKSQLGVK